MKHNLLILVVGVGILLAIFLIGAVLNTTQLSQRQLLQYSSEDGISFVYPDNYVLSSRQEGNEERQWDTLVLMDKDLAASIPEGGEGPPAMSLSVFQNIEQLSLEQWIRTTSYSNFKLSTQGALTSVLIGREPAFAYRYSGLYENDAVAVLHGGKIFLLTTGWMTPSDPIRNDFQTLIKSVHFTQ